ncbi:DoxX family protein [Luteipulveratus sp. YIM 133132]|uniref:DoxX family protein n=1 Tax=Luteipulveratus flavus TaxID=3031728 RepID=A0ABT6CEK2_9MICO|nr:MULTISPECIES: DoxX family protein [unclassified Luteipulveratus]MDE9365602.1 DoxX family protein [Luteipulveratus sp. YIM 133132]MDF8265721.1 DoxX family protein [Luteipulveratus sp. YIM 133296]
MKNPVRAVARLLIGSTYAMLGYDAWTAPGGRVDAAGSTLAALREVIPLPENDEGLVRFNGAVQTVGGAAIALGIMPRPAAAAVLGSLAPTTVAGHAFWKVDDPAARKQQQTQFMKNLAMLGGLVYIVLDG